MAEGGIAGTEIVESQSNREGVQGMQGGPGLGQLVHQQAFGDLQLQTLGDDAVLFQGLGYGLHQTLSSELAARNIDRQAQRWKPHLAPPTELSAGGIQHPPADRNDKTGILRQRNEPFGRHEAELFVRPAQQRLGADDLLRANVDDRLVVEFELVTVESVQQMTFKPHPLHRPQVQFPGKELKSIATVFLGPIHRRVGVLHQDMRLVAIVREYRDANARGYESLMVTQDE